MARRFWVTSLILGIAVALPFAVADEKKKDSGDETAEKGKKGEGRFSAKCPVSGEDAKKEQKAAYREKEVYFCCEKCKAAFEEDSAKYATKANHQLVRTRQFVQTKCPLSGGDLNKEQFTRVSGAKVSFCCEKCKGAIESASEEDQLSKIFADEVFAKSFEPRKEDAEGKKGKDK